MFLLHKESNGIANKLRMFLHNFFYSPFLQIFSLVFFQMQDNLCSMTHWFTCVSPHSEGSPSSGLPGVLLIIIMLHDDSYYLSNQICGVKTNTKLANHRDIYTSLQGLHEGFGA
ncbi:rCG64331 [Rattus norvegicus]|uniref:RCG64331 n=1 Tax=Rattus norvegicus TaxID=10116 RepID=A6IL19_RAT|nr:rCG64331 [Rattus norvegicus]